MASRRFTINGIGDVAMHKRRGSKSVRLSIAHDGAIRLTLPAWMPYRVGLEFIEQKRSWLLANRRQTDLLRDGLRVGKAHTLKFQHGSGQKPSVRVKETQIMVTIPVGMTANDDASQATAMKGAIKALKHEAERLLPQRLDALAKQHDFTYTIVSVKRLKSRWGSCNHRQEIILNSFLMQLPWQLIDYVIMHELVHTKILAHGKPFWAELGKYVDDLPSVRRVIRSERPYLRTD